MASLKRWLDLRRNPWKAPFHAAFKAWRAEDGTARHLHRYDDLPDDAVVFDIGGFEGGWTDTLRAVKPAATVHMFEPHPDFAAQLRQKYAGVPGIHVHTFALGREAGTLTLSDAGDASSGFGHMDGSLSGEVRPATAFFEETGITRVDLAKMNIEGGEYDLLPALIDSGLMTRIDRLQVQFHLFEPTLAEARDRICEGLAQTHTRVWCYPFVWEEWRRSDSAA